ncbi:DUF6203 family protein [Nonomuraea sp. CA-218870]|uniref:DUF6203 family protein n=1 Tax=Nonomuraea sp. CA-218870 TaxID=3239998 RepID=UPI003D8CB3B9
MKGFFKVVLARWLARTPLGLVALGIGWFVGRRRKQREQERSGFRRVAPRAGRAGRGAARRPRRGRW